MKTKTIKLFSLMAIFLTSLFILSGCAGINENFATKIKEKADAKEHYTYDDLKKKLGDPTINVSGSIGVIDVTGVVSWAKGCKNAEEMNKKFDDGKTVKVLVVTFLNGKATAAKYVEATSQNDVK